MTTRALGDILADLTGSREKLQAAAVEYRASPEEREAAEPAGPATVTGNHTCEREEIPAGGNMPGMQRDKPRTRSGDKWVVMPPKRTPGRTGAKDSGGIRQTQAMELHRLENPPTIGRSMAAARPTRRPTSAAVIDLVMWKKAHPRLRRRSPYSAAKYPTAHNGAS